MNTPPTHPGASPGAPPRRRFSIASYLGVGLGGLVVVALGLLLWITLSAVFKNTTELLNDKSRIFLGALTAQTRQYLDATLAPSKVAANQIGRGHIDPKVDREMMPLMRTLLAATPQVTAMAFFDVDGTRVVAFREDGKVETGRQTTPDREEIRAAMNNVQRKGTFMWGPPIYDPGVGTFVNLRRPVFRDADFIGMMTAVINVQVLSTFLDSLETEIGQNAFILYDRDYVLAHRKLMEPFPGLSEERPLPKVGEIDDPVLANIWQEGWEEQKLVVGSGHFHEGDERGYVFLYEPLDDYADAPWVVGSYFPENTIATQVRRMVASAVLSLIIMAAAVAATFFLGRLLRQPITRLADAASAVQKLDLDNVEPLPPSRFAELDDAGRAFNAMISALRTFSLYVPKTLVQRLMTREAADALSSELREVTVLMTDIVDFTHRAETMSAEETASFLNHHLALVTDCIEAEGGVVDKYMGDAVMAHWGALDPEPEQASRAVKAATRIAEAMGLDNLGQDEPVRLRIGIHRGPVVAGNIGATTRMNYTVVGDTVNMAQRLEALGKTLLPEADVAVLLSAETKRSLDRSVETRSLGLHELRGREERVEVFTLGSG